MIVLNIESKDWDSLQQFLWFHVVELTYFPFHFFFFFFLMAPGFISSLPGPTHLHKTHRHFPSPQHPSAQSKAAGAAVQQRGLSPSCHTSEVVSLTLIIPLWCHRGVHLRKRFQDLVEGTGAVDRPGASLAPVWLTDNTCRSLCSALC